MSPIIYLAAVAQSATAAPPAPPAPVSAPMIRVVPPTREVLVVDVEARAGGELIWQGPLRVAASSMSFIRQESNEPLASGCGRPNYVTTSSLERFKIALQPAYNAADRMTFTMSWGRPTAGACPTGTRTVELVELVTLLPRQPVTVTGDNGVTVRLTRR